MVGVIFREPATLCCISLCCCRIPAAIQACQARQSLYTMHHRKLSAASTNVHHVIIQHANNMKYRFLGQSYHSVHILETYAKQFKALSNKQVTCFSALHDAPRHVTPVQTGRANICSECIASPGDVIVCRQRSNPLGPVEPVGVAQHGAVVILQPHTQMSYCRPELRRCQGLMSRGGKAVDACKQCCWSYTCAYIICRMSHCKSA